MGTSVKTGEEKRHLGNNVDRDNCIKKKNKAGGVEGNNRGSCQMKRRNMGRDVTS